MTTELYTANTPNGQKPAIMLEEIGLPYQIFPINISQEEQHTDTFLAINPNGKIDHNEYPLAPYLSTGWT